MCEYSGWPSRLRLAEAHEGAPSNLPGEDLLRNFDNAVQFSLNGNRFEQAVGLEIGPEARPDTLAGFERAVDRLDPKEIDAAQDERIDGGVDGAAAGETA